MLPLVLPVLHPVSGHPHVDVPVLLVAAGASVAVILLGLLVPRGAGAADLDPPATSWAGSLSVREIVVRTASVLLLVLAVVAGRLGSDAELENLAPALVVGAAWPLLFAAALVVGPLWRWVDPWDAIGRLVLPRDQSEPSASAWPALPFAAAITWFLGVYPRPLDPSAVGTAVAVYTVLTVAGCVAVGRRRWLSSAEPVGVALLAVAQARLGRRRWSLPDRTDAVLGVLAGGIAFGTLRRTEAGVELLGTAGTSRLTVLHLVVCVVTAGLFVALSRVAMTLARGDRVPGSPAATGVAVAAAAGLVGLVVGTGLSRNRLTTSLQLLPGLFGDPLGRGWDLLGASTSGLDVAPVGAAGLIAVQISLVVATAAWGAVVLGRRLSRTERLPGVILLGQMAAAGVATVALH